MIAAAFFDVDGTLIRRPAALVVAPALRRAGIVTRRQLARAAWWEARARLRGSTEAELHAVTALGVRTLAGHPPALLSQIAEAELPGRLLPLAFPGALELVHGHRDRYEPVCAVTGALAEVAVPLTRRLGFDETVATIAATDAGGIYSGVVERSCHGQVKAVAVRELAARRGIDLAASAASSDSASDLDLLELVGRPHAVNPDRRLARIAAERGWPVLRFR